MKNKKILFTMIIAVLLSAMLAGCGARVAQTPDGFTEVMEASGFEVQDATEEADEGITAMLVATEENYQIDFFEFIDSGTAEDIFDEMAEYMNEEYSSKFMAIEIYTVNYSYFAFTSGDSFYMIARIDNTMLCSIAAKEYKSEIVDLAKTLGYK